MNPPHVEMRRPFLRGIWQLRCPNLLQVRFRFLRHNFYCHISIRTILSLMVRLVIQLTLNQKDIAYLSTSVWALMRMVFDFTASVTLIKLTWNRIRIVPTGLGWSVSSPTTSTVKIGVIISSEKLSWSSALLAIRPRRVSLSYIDRNSLCHTGLAAISLCQELVA